VKLSYTSGYRLKGLSSRGVVLCSRYADNFSIYTQYNNAAQKADNRKKNGIRRLVNITGHIAMLTLYAKITPNLNEPLNMRLRLLVVGEAHSVS